VKSGDAVPILAELQEELALIRLVAERFASSGSRVDPKTGALLLSHRPQVGEEAYACVLFPGISRETITRYVELQRRHHIGAASFDIPLAYRNLLGSLNGAAVFRLNFIRRASVNVPGPTTA
jgi:hypothetical protein